jgi:hypothetical protein
VLLPVAPYTVSLSVAAVRLVCLGAVAARAVAAFGPSGSGQPIRWPSARRERGVRVRGVLPRAEADRRVGA